MNRINGSRIEGHSVISHPRCFIQLYPSTALTGLKQYLETTTGCENKIEFMEKAWPTIIASSNVINVDGTDVLSSFIFERSIERPLICWRTVTEAEHHGNKFEKAHMGHKGCFGAIFRCDLDLSISRPSVEAERILATRETAEVFIAAGKRVSSL